MKRLFIAISKTNLWQLGKIEHEVDVNTFADTPSLAFIYH